MYGFATGISLINEEENTKPFSKYEKKNRTSTKYWYSHIGLLHVATKPLTWKQNI